ncbi:MAG: hypothetical protein ACJ72N_23285 [Labedaea sp.]
MTAQRAALPGERCTCGRQAVTVFVRDTGAEVGYCGLPDGGNRTGPCPFCGGQRHSQPWGDSAPCPDYQLRPQPQPGVVSVDDDIADTWIALPDGGMRFLTPDTL